MFELIRAVVAAFLLCSDVQPPNEVIRFVRFPIRQICIASQVASKDEFDTFHSYVFLTYDTTMSSDLDVLRRRVESCRHLPRLEELRLFVNTPQPEARALVDFSEAHIAYLEMFIRLHPGNSSAAQRHLNEAYELYRIWSHLLNSRLEFFSVVDRRTYLLKLKQALGDEMYYSGRMPPHVPLWRFTEVRP